jgi:hypothetical protein
MRGGRSIQPSRPAAETRSRIASIAVGFSRLDRSPGSSPVTVARIARRRIFAERVLGSSGTTTTFDGRNALPR